MPKSIAFILLFFSLKSYCQDTLILKTIGGETAVKNYVFQSSIDQKAWSNIKTFQPQKLKDSNLYKYPLTTQNLFYRAVANMQAGSYTSNPLLYASPLPVNITNTAVLPSQKYVTVTWVSQNENNLKGYEIDRSWDSITFENVATVPAKGNSTYSIQITRPTTTTTKGWWFWKKTVTTIDSRKAFYKIISVDNDGVKNNLIILNG